MELKLFYPLLSGFSLQCLNCTVMELKLKNRDWNLIATLGLNCTVMELKPVQVVC